MLRSIDRLDLKFTDPTISLLTMINGALIKQSVTKIVRLAPPAPLFKVGCKFAWSLLATTAWHSFSRLGTTLNEGEGEF